MKPWKQRSVLLGFLVAWMAVTPAFLYAAEFRSTNNSFLCHYLTFILRPVGLCQELPAEPTVIPGVALSPVQKKFVIESVPAIPVAAVPQVLGVATTTVPAWSVPVAVVTAVTAQRDTTATMAQVAPYLQAMVYAQQFTLQYGVAVNTHLEALATVFEKQRAHDGDQYTSSRTVTTTDTTATSLQNGTADFSALSLVGPLRDSTGVAGTAGSVLQSTVSGVLWVATSSLGIVSGGGGGSGTVTSVGLTAPTGFTVSGSPVTTAGTLALTYTAGYGAVLTASSTNWNSFYTTPSTRITAGTGLAWTANTLSLNTAGDWSGTFGGQSGAYYLDRTNHTGTQSTSTITGAFDIAHGGTGATTSISARTNLGLGTLATQNTVDNSNWSGAALALVNGGTGTSTASGARSNLGATTVGANLFTLANPDATTFLRVNADNSISALDAGSFLAAIGAGAASGTVASVALAAPTGFSVSGSPVTSSGTLTFSYAAGYEALLSASSTDWNNFYTTPSARITAGSGLAWTGNSLSLNTSGDWTGTFGGQNSAYYLDRTNHTGTQATSTITGVFDIAHGGTNATTSVGARSALGLGLLATLDTIDDSLWSGASLSIAHGGTGATSSAAARTNLGLGALALLSTIDNTYWSGVALTGANGGTGLSSITQNQLLIGGTGNTWSQVATSALGLSNVFANSAALAALLSDETGTGSAVFSDAPTFTGTVALMNTAVSGTLVASGTSTFASKVGIGTTTPFSKLTIDVGATADGVTLFGNVNGSVHSEVINRSSASGAYAEFSMFNDLDTNAGTGIGSSNASPEVYADRGYLYGYGVGVSLVAGNAGGDIRFFTDGDGVANERMRITSSGNVGIGSTTPFAKLTVAGNGHFAGNLTSTGTLTILGVSTLASTTISNLSLATALTGTSGGTGLSSITQNQLLIGGAGNTWTQIATSSLGFSSLFTNSAALAALLSDETGTGSAVFSSSPIFSGTAVFADLQATGRINIGTTSTAELLTLDTDGVGGGILVTGDVDAHTYSWVHNSNGGSAAFSEFYADNSVDSAMSVGVGSLSSVSGVYDNRAYLWAGSESSRGLSLIAASSTGDMRFFTGGETITNERMRITSSGNVGIGTTTPNSKFSVVGSAYITGTSTFATTTITSLTLATALGATSGGTGLSTVTQNQLLIGGAGNTWTQVATSSLGLGTVSSVALSVPTGFSVSGSPITSAGTLALSYAAGYEGLLSASSTNWNNFYNTPSAQITAGNGLAWTANTLGLGGVMVGSSTIDTVAANVLTLTSTLSSAGRTTYPMIISQANDVTRNNSVGLLQLDNADSGSTAAVLNVNQIGGGNGINVTGITSGTGISFSNTTGTAVGATNISSGIGINVTGLTSGIGISASFSNSASTASVVRITGGGSGITADYTGAVVDISPARTLTAAATRNDSGSFLRVQRSNTTNNASAVLNMSGTLATISSNCTVTLGSCTDTSTVLSLSQSFASSTGDVLTVSGAGSGNLATFDAANSSANGVSVDIQSNASNRFALQVTANNGATKALSVFANGSVAIGTSTAAEKLSIDVGTSSNGLAITGNAAGSVYSLVTNHSTSSAAYAEFAVVNDIDTYGGVGIGSALANPGVYADRGYLYGSGEGVSLVANTTDGDIRLFTNGETTADEKMRIMASGNVGIGTTTPSAQLTTTGTVQFSNFGAGTLQTDANGNLSVSSDERLKDIEGPYTAGLPEVLGLQPILFKWNATSGLERNTVYAGFSAQNVKDFLPDAVGEDKHGYLTLSDRSILAAVVNAIHELWTKVQGIDTRSTENAAAIDVLKQENDALKARLDAIEAEAGAASVSGPQQSSGNTAPTPEVTTTSTTEPDPEVPPVSEETTVIPEVVTPTESVPAS